MSLSVAIIPVTAFAQNCSILMCNKSKKAAVVDPGGDLERIVAQLQRMGATAEKILLTHAHIDHAGGTAALARQLNIPIEGPQEGDLFWIQGLPNQSAMFGFPPAEVFTPDRWLQDNDTVTVGEVTLQVIHTPGHTPGHVVFYSANDKLAIVGDVLFQGSIGRTDFPQGNHEQLVHSIRAKLFPLGDDITFIPGHGPESTFGQERRTNPFVADHRG
ncbi:MBL fold metallo-hydrolase [Venatoribacter cucullus]|uniref:MBL fold metallo-hydrolase n=1 Tax=Venatoribacter cucullus TaxID=2661630 RepID=A0A9X7YPU0_9GAMM|nr:MBL fold metallo-hydrolase [Venatoribacter cucullus]QQD22482.1 MBL fold metallo-hydrolase [Oceanospirillaceae bacterium ASx5O]QQD25111.1 MBL fold metallo-hydrolase [Venatoribacter cucullus]